MIVLTQKPTFEADVEIHIASEKKPECVRFVFRVMDRKRLNSLLIMARLIERSRLRRLTEYLRLCWRVRGVASVADMLDELIVSWNESISEPYSRTNLQTLITEYPGTHIVIFTSYLKGLGEARRKN